MSKTYKIMLGGLVLLLILLTYLEAKEPQEINWNASYSRFDKIPLGSYVLFENLKEQNLKMEEVNLPPFEFLENPEITGTYLFLNDQLELDAAELKKLLSWVEKGNTAVLIAENFSEKLLDTLNLEMKTLVPENGISSRPLLNFSSKTLKTKEAFSYDRETYLQVFSKYDTLDHEVLGLAQLQEDSVTMTAPNPNFIRDSIGKGVIYLHSFPKAFSNYFLLGQGKAEYAERALAYIPQEKLLYWDSYYKTGRAFNSSPLYVILNHKALTWAYYFLLIGSVLFIFFEGKRKQRSIPVIEPLRNQSLDFTRTVATMHLESNDYKGITNKKIALFLDHVRTQYRIDTQTPGQDFYRRLAALSDNPVKEVEQLWRHIRHLQEQLQISKEDVQQLNRGINNFKRK